MMITEFLSLPLSPGKCSMRYSHSICNALDIVNNPEMTQSIGRNTQLHANSIALDVKDLHPPIWASAGDPGVTDVQAHGLCVRVC